MSEFNSFIIWVIKMAFYVFLAFVVYRVVLCNVLNIPAFYELPQIVSNCVNGFIYLVNAIF